MRSYCRRAFEIAFLLAFCGAARAEVLPFDYLDQGWTDSQRQSWYTTSQGSRLLPLSWFLALELPQSGAKLSAPANMQKYGYLANPAPGSTLPVGFASDTGPSPDGSTVPWVGMTCSACHTVEMTYQGKRFRVDGAPTLADFQTFMEDVTASLKATADDPVKFAKFSAEVLLANPGMDETRLKSELKAQADWYVKLAGKNGASIRYGHGRLDAQGHILNKASLVLGVPQQITDHPSDAPASYPFLWYTPIQERVQWNGLVEHGALGGVPRNIGQFVGVFGVVDVASDPASYASSVRGSNLAALEDLAKALKSPVWPDHIFPKLGARTQGERLFKKHCADCHNSVDRATGAKTDPDRPLAQMQSFAEIGTDIWLACNTFQHTSKSGQLEGRIDNPFVNSAEQHRIGAQDKTTFMLTNMVTGVVTKLLQTPEEPRTAQLTQVERIFFGSRERTALQRGDLELSHFTVVDSRGPRAMECRQASRKEAEDPEKKAKSTLAYKGGPLNGIWATAPYLHNGSVPTLDDLLKPPSRRPTSFSVGSTEFDPVHVGFKFAPGEGLFEFRVRDANGKVIPGNDNAGHTYGVSLSKTQRKALLEYLKSL